MPNVMAAKNSKIVENSEFRQSVSSRKQLHGYSTATWPNVLSRLT